MSCGALFGFAGIALCFPGLVRDHPGVALLVAFLSGGAGTAFALFIRNPHPGKGVLVGKWAAMGMAGGVVGGFVCAGWLFAGFSPSLGGGNPHAGQAFNAEAGVGGAVGLGVVGAVLGALYGITAGRWRK